MFVYNVTIKVIPEIAEAWLAWLQQEHIPDVLNTGCFTKAHCFRLLEVDDSEGPSFVVQYYAPDRAAYDRYIATYASGMRQKGMDKWGNRFIAFRTVMHML